MKSKSQTPCPHCQNDDDSLIEILRKDNQTILLRCDVCSKLFMVPTQNVLPKISRL